jgi:hypothetical protein
MLALIIIPFEHFNGFTSSMILPKFNLVPEIMVHGFIQVQVCAAWNDIQ